MVLSIPKLVSVVMLIARILYLGAAHSLTIVLCACLEHGSVLDQDHYLVVLRIARPSKISIFISKYPLGAQK